MVSNNLKEMQSILRLAAIYNSLPDFLKPPNVYEVAKPKLSNYKGKIIIIGTSHLDNGLTYNILSDSFNNNQKIIPLNINCGLEVVDNITQPLNIIREDLLKLNRVFNLSELRLNVSQLYDSLRDKVIIFEIKHLREYDISRESFYSRYQRIKLSITNVTFINNRLQEIRRFKTFRLSKEHNGSYTLWYFANQFDRKLKYVDEVQDLLWLMKKEVVNLPDNRWIRKNEERGQDI